MNWFRPNNDDPQGASNNPPPPSSTPDADELRRRRIAKLEAAQAAEKARRKDLEERKAKWQSERQAAAATAPPPPPKPTPPPPPQEPVEPVPKRPALPLPPVEVQVSRAVARVLGLALDERSASADAVFDPVLITQLREDAGLSATDPLLLTADVHADDVLLNRINAVEDPLNYLFSTFTRCAVQTSEIGNNRRLSGVEHDARRTSLREAVVGVEHRTLMYAGMVLNGAFMETDNVTPLAFATLLMDGKVPTGFIRALLTRYTEVDGPGLDDLEPIFSGVFHAVRARAQADMRLSSSGFLKPLETLFMLVSHKELSRILTADPTFVPKSTSSQTIVTFAPSSYLYPFFRISALPGLPLGQHPLFPEDPAIASSMFPNPTMMDRTEAEGTIYSLRSSLSVARSYLARICLSLCKGGPEPRNATLDWLATVCNLNKKRSGMQPDPRVTSRDGFMLNVMHVMLKLCDPIVSGGWRMLQKIDPTYPQSSFRLNYDDETRLAADTDILKRWWVDQRNENAQESLTRQLEVVARESGLPSAAASSSSDASASTNSGEPMQVASEFNFVTECFWLALRTIQLGFVSVVNMYDEDLMRVLHRLKEVIDDMEGAKANGPLPRDQEMQLADFKQRFEKMLQAKLCYDVYLHDPEFLSSLVRFVTADAEWIMKKLLVDPKRESILPLPLPVDRTFASLPEHTVETITTVLLTAMRSEHNVVQEHSSLLDEMVSFCIVGSASPLHVRNPYLRAKLVEFLWTIFPRGSRVEEDEDDPLPPPNPAMEALFAGHELSRKFLPGSLFRLYVDVEHTGSHTQFSDKFSIRYRIGSILESVWSNPDYRKSVRNEARDESRFLRFVNMLLNDANHLLDSVLDDLEEMHSLETLIKGGSPEWEALTDEEKSEKQDRLQKLQGSAKGYNQLANNNVKLLWLLTGDEVVKRIFLRDEMVSRLAEMLNYLLVRLCGQRCNDLVVSDPTKVSWKPRQLLSRIMDTYTHFHEEDLFSAAVARDGRSYNADLFTRAIGIAKRRRILPPQKVQMLQQLSESAARALEADNEEEEDLGDIPEEFLDPIMSSLMRNPVKLPTSGKVMDRAVISRILLSDKSDPFNRKLLTEDMLEDDVDLKKRILEFVKERRSNKAGSRGTNNS